LTEADLFEVKYFDVAKNDYNKLNGSQKVFVDKGLARIRILGMKAGQRLSGNLSSCNKLKNKKTGLRIIFTRENQQIKVIHIVVIGKREDKKVYKIAEQRIKNSHKNES